MSPRYHHPFSTSTDAFKKGLHIYHRQVFLFAAAVTNQYYTAQCYWSLLYEAAELLYFPEFERNYIIVRNLKKSSGDATTTHDCVGLRRLLILCTHFLKTFKRWRMNCIASCCDSSVEIGCWVTWDEGSMGLCSATSCFSPVCDFPQHTHASPKTPFIAPHLRNADFKHLYFSIATMSCRSRRHYCRIRRMLLSSCWQTSSGDSD